MMFDVPFAILPSICVFSPIRTKRRLFLAGVRGPCMDSLEVAIEMSQQLNPRIPFLDLSCNVEIIECASNLVCAEMVQLEPV